jgi:class 3 adenylate cyclase/tetratricopeptide (TPR) repeat protein
MAQVFRAWDEVLHREVALKFLLPRVGCVDEALREARAIAQLDHVNIVRVFDESEWRATPEGPGIPYLVMECLEGESLSARLKLERLDVRSALDIMDGIVAGLAHAHERHVIHRDLKPRNVFLTWEGTVKLLDFGLSHFTSATAAPHLPTAGTPAYMAPEQWRGEPQDARTDIWAAGVVLYEMLTGTLPWSKATFAQLRERVTSQEPMPPLRAHWPEVPRELEALLATALDKDPARRFRSALELREELREVRGRLFGPARERRRTAVAQRRQVTLVSCLLTGLGRLGGPLDAEDLGELELAFHEACAEVIEQHGGSVPLSLAGEVLACFGYPQVREDDSERAVRAGLRLARDLPEALQHRVPHLSLSGVAVKVGIHTDTVALDERAAGPPGGGLVIQGEAPKVAAWLAGQAAPGRVVLGDATWHMVRGAFETEVLGQREFEGLSGTSRQDVHLVLREREATVRFERALATEGLLPLVGRERELRRLEELWALAQRGQGAFLLVRGEAGIGKSRLLRELYARVPPESSIRVRFQCWSRLSTTALHPFLQLLQELFQLPPGRSPRELHQEVLERMARMGLSVEQTQLLRLLMGLPVDEDAPVRLLTPERRKEMALRTMVDLVPHLARERPVLAVVEDLHWADSTELEFLRLLLERAERARLLVLLSTRTEVPPSWPRCPWLHGLTLERLPAEQAAVLVRETARGRELSEETVRKLVRRTEGIPLFIGEMTRMLLEQEAGSLTEVMPGSIPVTLRELLLARLDRLPTRQRALVQLCSIVGRDFSRALVVVLTGRDEAALDRDLDGLVEAGFLQEQREAGEPAYQFQHALIQEVASQSLSRSTRRQYHRHIARVLAEHFPALAEAKPEVLARHFTEAGAYASAVRYWFRAGQLANQRLASQEAVEHLTQALKLLRELPDARQHAREELQILLALGLPLSHVQGFRSSEVRRTYGRARELFLQMGEELPRIELSLWGPFAYHYARAELGPFHELARLLVDLGERRQDQTLLAVGYRMTSTAQFLWGHIREAVADIDRAVVCARFDLEQHRGLASLHWTDPKTTALGFAGIIHSVEGHLDEARSCARSALELAGRIGHAHTTAYALTYAAVGCQIRREPGEALRWADQALTLSGERSYWLWRSWSTMVRGWALSELGRHSEGLALIQEELRGRAERGIRAGVPHGYSMLAELHLKLGNVGEGLEATSEALAEMKATGERAYEAELLRVQGELLRARGRERKARASFVRAIEMASRQGAGLFELRTTVSLCRLLRDSGRAEEAGPLLVLALGRLDDGSDGLDLREARALMKELRPEAGPSPSGRGLG